MVNLKSLKKPFVMYQGDDSNLRFKIFAQGHFTFPQVEFIHSDCPYAEQEENLKKDNIYFYEPESGFKMYKKAFKSNRFLHWVSLMLHTKVKEVVDGH